MEWVKSHKTRYDSFHFVTTRCYQVTTLWVTIVATIVCDSCYITSGNAMIK